MRLEAGVDPDAYRYIVYHAERCEIMRTVKWVDDETAQYGEWIMDGPLTRTIETRQAKRIAIYSDRMLVIINPIADEQDAPAVVDAIAA